VEPEITPESDTPYRTAQAVMGSRIYGSTVTARLSQNEDIGGRHLNVRKMGGAGEQRVSTHGPRYAWDNVVSLGDVNGLHLSDSSSPGSPRVVTRSNFWNSTIRVG
jgi:hypothetical protein